MATDAKSVRRRLTAAMAAMAVLAAPWACRAGEGAERFLPPHTLLYGGVEKLGPALAKALALARRIVPGQARLQGDRLFPPIAQGLGLQGVRTQDELLAAAGLDPQGSAAVAYVLADPSFEPFRTPNQNVLVVLPLADAAKAERVLALRFAPGLRQASASICRATARRLERAKQRWSELHPDEAPRPLAWEDLAEANPGLEPLLCPAGGEYELGAPGQPVRCSLHAEGRGPPGPEEPLTPEALGVAGLGDVKLVGGTVAGTGYALGPRHLVLSNHMGVLEAAVKAAAGTGPRLRLPAPGALADRDGRFTVGFRYLLWEARREVEKWRRRRASPAAERLLELIGAGGRVAGDLRLGDPIALGFTWEVPRVEATAGLLDRAPAPLGALGLVPDSARLAVGTNLAREVFSVIGDAAMLDEPAAGAVVKLAMAAAEGDAALALTPGAFAHGQSPNVLLVLRIGDERTMRAAAEVWSGILARRSREGEGLERRQVAGVEVRTVPLRDGAVHYAFVGDHLVGGTALEDVEAAIALHAQGPGPALPDGERFRQLELPQGPANLVAFADVHELVRQLAENDRQRQNHWRNQACRRHLRRLQGMVREYRDERGRLPRSFDELEALAKEKGRGTLRDHCPMFGQEAKLELDPRTGQVACPRHGTADDFRAVDAAEPHRLRDDQKVLSALGTLGLQLRVEEGRLRGELRLLPRPVPQEPR
ncbi:MAG: hypothetical protein ACLF0G_13465 [Candidatus Brocadiia bacterium]